MTQAGAHGPLRVVLVHDGHPEDSDHGVADELLHDAAVRLDRRLVARAKYSRRRASTSSGSAASVMLVKPTRSQKRVVTVLRSSEIVEMQ